MGWTEMYEMLGLEKGNFKGQSAGKKVMKLHNKLLDYQMKAPELGYAEAQSLITRAKRKIHGAI